MPTITPYSSPENPNSVPCVSVCLNEVKWAEMGINSGLQIRTTEGGLITLSGGILAMVKVAMQNGAMNPTGEPTRIIDGLGYCGPEKKN